MNIALSIRNLRIQYPGDPVTTAVSGVDLEIHAGEVVGLVGESGCGKSSIASAVMGILDRPSVSADEIRLGDKELTTLSERQYQRIRGREISMVFQEPLTALDPVLSIGTQIGEILKRHGVASRKDVASKSHDVLQGMNLGDIPAVLRSYPHQLSGGMRQRIIIAMAMACRPSVLLADEPTTALDVTTQAQVLDSLLKTGRENNTGILLITHDLAVAASVCERIIVMRDGAFVESARTSTLLNHPQHPYTVRLLRSVPGIAKRHAHPSPPRGDEIMRLDGHSVSHPVRKNGRHHQLVAVNDVNLEICRGEILALVGESGSGKSTLAQSLLGLKNAHNNSIQFSGTTVNGKDRQAWSQVRRHVQLVLQDPRASLSPRRTVGQSLVEPLDHFGIDTPAERPARVARALERVGLEAGDASKLPHELSGGQRQRVALARALISEPDLVVADEPLSSLDVSIQAKIIELILQLREELGFGVLIVSHDLAVVRQLADRVAVMYLGRIVETAAVDVLFEQPAHPYTQALLSAIPLAPDASPAGKNTRKPIIGDPPSLLTPPPGCVFHTRCPDVLSRCRQVTPPGLRLDTGPPSNESHKVHCLLYENQE